MSFRSPKLLKAAKDQACVLCGRTGSTVSAHCNMTEHGKGIGIKAPDCLIAWLCQACHRELDSGRLYDREMKREMWYRAFARTVVQLFEQGIVIVK